MFDLAMELLDAEQAKKKARISFEAASAEFIESTDVDEDVGDDDPEMQAKLVRAREAVAGLQRSKSSGWQEPRREGSSSAVAPAAMDLPEFSGDPAQAQEAQRVQLHADSRRHAEEVAQRRNAKTSGGPRKMQQGSCW